MRIKFLSVIVSLLLMSVAVSSCLDSDDNSYDLSSDATIRAFGLDTITKGVYCKFQIDQVRNIVFNIDSLPVGSEKRLSRILVDTLQVTGWVTAGLNDTLFNMNDSVDLSSPIKLKVHAADRISVREYTIQVNVHQQDPDSLVWVNMEKPFADAPVAGKQKSVILNEDLYIYTSPTTAYHSSIAQPWTLQWTQVSVSGLPEDAKISSIVNFNDQLYVTAESGKAYSSANGENWQELDMQGLQMVTFIADIPGDEVTGNKRALAGIFTEEGKNYFCKKNIDETEWSKGQEIPGNFPLEDIYATVQTIATGYKRAIIAGTTQEATKATIPWFSEDEGLNWVNMQNDVVPCPAMKNPSIMFYGNVFYIFGGEFEAIYSSLTGIAWYETEKKFMLPTNKIEVPGTGDDESTITYEGIFKGKGDYSLAIDKNNYIWIVWNEDCSVWRGRLNKLGFARQ